MLSQEAISGALGVESGKPLVIDENLEPLTSFFNGYGFGVEHFNPFYCFGETDLFIKERLDRLKKGDVDMLVGFDYFRLYEPEKEDLDEGCVPGHFALITDFQQGQDPEVFLHDNQRGKVE